MHVSLHLKAQSSPANQESLPVHRVSNIELVFIITIPLPLPLLPNTPLQT